MWQFNFFNVDVLNKSTKRKRIKKRFSYFCVWETKFHFASFGIKGKKDSTFWLNLKQLGIVLSEKFLDFKRLKKCLEFVWYFILNEKQTNKQTSNYLSSGSHHKNRLNFQTDLSESNIRSVRFKFENVKITHQNEYRQNNRQKQ